MVSIWEERRVFGGLSMKLFSVKDDPDDLVPRSPAPGKPSALASLQRPLARLKTTRLQRMGLLHLWLPSCSSY